MKVNKAELRKILSLKICSAPMRILLCWYPLGCIGDVSEISVFKAKVCGDSKNPRSRRCSHKLPWKILKNKFLFIFLIRLTEITEKNFPLINEKKFRQRINCYYRGINTHCPDRTVQPVY
jgi:hypothetical protein